MFAYITPNLEGLLTKTGHSAQNLLNERYGDVTTAVQTGQHHEIELASRKAMPQQPNTP